MANAKMGPRGGTLGDVMLGRGADQFPNTVQPPQATNCNALVLATLGKLSATSGLIEELESVISSVTGEGQKASSSSDLPVAGSVMEALRMCVGQSDYVEGRLRFLINHLRETLGV